LSIFKLKKFFFKGIPLGLIGAIPLLLQSKGITYAQQAVFSFAYWPFRFSFFNLKFGTCGLPQTFFCGHIHKGS